MEHHLPNKPLPPNAPPRASQHEIIKQAAGGTVSVSTPNTLGYPLSDSRVFVCSRRELCGVEKEGAERLCRIVSRDMGLHGEVALARTGWFVFFGGRAFFGWLLGARGWTCDAQPRRVHESLEDSGDD